MDDAVSNFACRYYGPSVYVSGPYTRDQIYDYEMVFGWYSGEKMGVDRAVIEKRDDGSFLFYEESGNTWYKDITPFTTYYQKGFILKQLDGSRENIWSAQPFTCKISNSWFGSDDVEECNYAADYDFTTNCYQGSIACSEAYEEHFMNRGGEVSCSDWGREFYCARSTQCTSDANTLVYGALQILYGIRKGFDLYSTEYNRPECFIEQFESIAGCAYPESNATPVIHG